MPEEEKIYFNALNLASFANYQLLSFLKKHYSSFQKAYQDINLKDLSLEKSFSQETLENFYQRKEKIDPYQEWEKLKKENIKLLLLEDDNYPPLLKEIPSPPLGLYQLGEFSLEKKFLAVVGTRKLSDYGRMVTEKLVKDLVEKTNFTIVSGLAYGVDSLAHKICLENEGETLAVLGSGLDIIYPPANKKLAQQIIQKGALLSEYPLGTPPLKHHFPRRNRLISGLSLGILIIEAPLHSGSLITARFALEQNREVFVVPGSIFSKNLEGSHELIKSGAKLVTKLEDILWELNLPFDFMKYPQKIPENLETEEKILLEIIQSSEKPLNVEEIVEKSNLPINLITRYLTFLELKNLIKEEGGFYRKVF